LGAKSAGITASNQRTTLTGKQNHYLKKYHEEGRIVSTQRSALRKEWEIGTFATFTDPLDR
jgi:hypothetical protein